MISACVCTHNPKPEIFSRCLASLRSQVLPEEGLELVVVDNASAEPLTVAGLGLADFPYPARVEPEPEAGLMHARLRGLAATRGEVLVFVDDDNFLEPGYVAGAARLFREEPRAGVAGGRCLPAFESAPPVWFDDVRDGLAIRDLGGERRCLGPGQPAPVGAGMVLRRAAFEQATSVPLLLVGRKGAKLTSGEDNELCYRVQRLGWQAWYDPALILDHFLPAARLEPGYLERLHAGFGRASCSMELYGGFQPRLRPLWYLRRAFFHWREVRRELRAAEGAANERDRVRSRIKAAGHRGRMEGMLDHARSRPPYELVERFARLTANVSP